MSGNEARLLRLTGFVALPFVGAAIAWRLSVLDHAAVSGVPGIIMLALFGPSTYLLLNMYAKSDARCPRLNAPLSESLHLLQGQVESGLGTLLLGLGGIAWELAMAQYEICSVSNHVFFTGVGSLSASLIWCKQRYQYRRWGEFLKAISE